VPHNNFAGLLFGNLTSGSFILPFLLAEIRKLGPKWLSWLACVDAAGLKKNLYGIVIFNL
jgi:hypothetical protein